MLESSGERVRLTETDRPETSLLQTSLGKAPVYLDHQLSGIQEASK